jgi:hypothetical protein
MGMCEARAAHCRCVVRCSSRTGRGTRGGADADRCSLPRIGVARPTPGIAIAHYLLLLLLLLLGVRVRARRAAAPSHGGSGRSSSSTVSETRCGSCGRWRRSRPAQYSKERHSNYLCGSIAGPTYECTMYFALCNDPTTPARMGGTGRSTPERTARIWASLSRCCVCCCLLRFDGKQRRLYRDFTSTNRAPANPRVRCAVGRVVELTDDTREGTSTKSLSLEAEESAIVLRLVARALAGVFESCCVVLRQLA